MTTPWPIILPGRIVGGKIQTNAKRLAAELKNRRDCEIEIVIERKHATRSLAQNALYWSVYVYLIAEHTGHSKDEIHEYLKARFLPKQLRMVDANGELKDEYTVGQTTTKLNKIEFGAYLEDVAKFASEELGLVIPPARESIDDRRLA